MSNTAPQPQQRFGRFELLNLIGKGGMAEVYKARILNGSRAGEIVALKRLLPELASDAECVDLFTGEADISRLLKHPNIVEVRRFFRANGTAYIVMKYEKGVDFETVIESPDVMYEEDLRSIIGPLLEGLAAVHSQGFLHRDIKPSNIYIRAGDFSPVLLDFGAARAALKTKSQKMTALVTPGYAPFEQYSSDGNNGPWSDIYGIGAVETPLPEQARAGRGPAYLAAREAVTAAKSSPWHLRAVAADDDRADRVRALESALWLWAALLGRRTSRGWEVADLVDQGLTYDEAAGRLGITQSAVSQRAAAAGIAEGRRARELVEFLTRTALGGGR